MADRDQLDSEALLEMSDARMGWALNPDNTHPVINAIDSLRLAVLAASKDLVEALDERAALANGTQVVVVDDEDDDEPFEGHCGGYFCEVHDIHISCSHPDYELLVEDHEAQHDGVRAGDGERVPAEIDVLDFLSGIHVDDPLRMSVVTIGDVQKLVRMVRAALPAAAVEMARVIGMEP